MRQRLPIVLSATALVIAVLGSTPLGWGAKRTVLSSAAGQQVAPVTDAQTVEAMSPGSSATYRTVAAQCPAGKSAIGGGAVATAKAPGFPVFVRYSYPDGNTWRAQASEATLFAGVWRLKVIAICAVT